MTALTQMFNFILRNSFTLVSLAKNNTSANPVPRFAVVQGELKSAVRIALALLETKSWTIKVALAPLRSQDTDV